MTLKFSRDSIRYRFLLTIALVLVAGTFALSATIAVNEWAEQQAQLQQKGKGLAQYVAKLCQDPLIMNDTIQLDSIVNEARYDDEILYTVIIDRSGAIITSQFASINYQSPRIALLKEKLRGLHEIDRILQFIKSTEASVEVSAPVITGSQTIGRVVVCLSRHNIISSIVSTVAFIIVINIGVALILAMILFVVSRRIIFNPISQLAGAARQLARGDLGARLTTSATGEMQQLIDSFNQMA
ncbi:MAG: methyl-accepting chemotaxis sensory transducer, partial [Deltaproteobacteria bacterium]|nr:methyl-accepting chemotaxis sensory transducer [Deltaproteobacteria bacterium]